MQGLCGSLSEKNSLFYARSPQDSQFGHFTPSFYRGQNCGEIMTQHLCSKQETLLQPQEEDIKRFSKGEQTSIFSGEISHSLFNCVILGQVASAHL